MYTLEMLLYQNHNQHLGKWCVEQLIWLGNFWMVLQLSRQKYRFNVFSFITAAIIAWRNWFHIEYVKRIWFLLFNLPYFLWLNIALSLMEILCLLFFHYVQHGLYGWHKFNDNRQLFYGNKNVNVYKCQSLPFYAILFSRIGYIIYYGKVDFLWGWKCKWVLFPSLKQHKSAYYYIYIKTR